MCSSSSSSSVVFLYTGLWNSCFWYSSASSFSRSGSHSCTAGLWPLEEETHHTGYVWQAPARCLGVSAFHVTTPTWLPLVPQALFLHILFLLLGSPSLSSSFSNCSPFKTSSNALSLPWCSQFLPPRVSRPQCCTFRASPQLSQLLEGSDYVFFLSLCWCSTGKLSHMLK